MKLHYCKTPLGNFGDDLNTWLWPTLLGKSFFDTHEDSLFLGVGTILNQKLPKSPEKIVLGTGTGYQRPPKVDGNFSICCSTLSSNKKQITASLGASLGCTIIVFNAKTQDLNLLFNVIAINFVIN